MILVSIFKYSNLERDIYYLKWNCFKIGYLPSFLLGHYCTLGSEESAPISKSYGDYCPAGFYCPDGTYDPVPCPSGTFLNETGMGMVDDCIKCSPGFYCETTGKTVVTAMCDQGYYCTLGANISAPQDTVTGMAQPKLP